MTIQFSCPHCGKQTSVADQYAGQSGPCAGCGQMVTIPGPAPVAVGAPSAGTGAGAAIGVIVAVAMVGLVLCGGVLVALLLPAVQAAREAARRSQCTNNLKQISIAMLNYEASYGKFPPAYSVDANGNPLHSWRTHLLPFIEQQGLYDAIDKTKPWNAPENMALTQMPLKVYCCPSEPGSKQNRTDYVVITGPGLIFDAAKPTSIRDITDGTSNTVLVVEIRGSTIPWAEPRDLDINQISLALNQGNQDALGSRHAGIAMVAMADGSVRPVSVSVSPQELRKMLTKNGGETVMPW